MSFFDPPICTLCQGSGYIGIPNSNQVVQCPCQRVSTTAEILAKLLRENGWTCEAPDDTR